MKYLSVFIYSGLLLFSSCAFWHGDNDTRTDAALGLQEPADVNDADQEIRRIQRVQAEEQKRQLERNITDTQNQSSPVTS